MIEETENKTEEKIKRKFVLAWWETSLLILLVALIIYWLTK